jgi:DNA-binding NarL/FixJ family response regulator
MPDIQVAVVEDQKVDRENLVRLLSSSPGFRCVAACVSAEEAFKRLPVISPEVVLMDIELPGLSGIECVARLRTALPNVQIMMLTVLEDHQRIFESLRAGATGYLLKSGSDAKLLEAIRELRAGGAPMTGQIARMVVASFHKLREESPSTSGLSPTEFQVLSLLAKGLLYKEVAERMELSMGTIRTHIWHIYRKLEVNNRTEATLKVFPRGV